MSTDDLAPVAFVQSRQRLTDQIRMHAAGTRAKTVRALKVRHAVECGQALSQLKKLLPHGGWDQWVEAECALSRATANRYIRLASRADRLTPKMSIREAYLAAGVINPKPPRAQAPPRPGT